MKIREIEVWEAFVAVAHYGNFSKAAKGLRVPLPQISKRVSKLENHLGVRLFQRSTRVVSLTDEGKALLPKANTLLEDLKNIETSFEEKGEVSGTVRLTCPPFIAHRFLIPVLQKFKKKFPEVQIEIDLSEQIAHLIESNYDMAIRIDEPENSDLVYRRLAANELVICASPNYLKQNKTPLKSLRDLKHHPLLFLSIHGECHFKGSPQSLKEFADSREMICENGWFLTQLALEGFGILVRSIWDVRDEISSGRLVQVLKNHPLEPFGHLYAVIPSRRFLAPRVRVFMDFILIEAEKFFGKT